jgi:hypothetical protein
MDYTEATLNDYAENILDAAASASESDWLHGNQWYPVAHELAEIIGHGDVRKGAGIIAALSPQLPWERNVELAQDASAGTFHGCLPLSLDRARRSYEGEDPATVLPTDSKTWNFWRNILDPEDPDPVTIDRHAYAVAVREPLTSLTSKQYGFLAQAYRLAVIRFGIENMTACRLQAVTWTWYRRTK